MNTAISLLAMLLRFARINFIWFTENGFLVCREALLVHAADCAQWRKVSYVIFLTGSRFRPRCRSPPLLEFCFSKFQKNGGTQHGFLLCYREKAVRAGMGQASEGIRGCWFDLYSKPNIREATQEQYSNFLEKHLIPNIGNIPLEQLTSLRLQKLYQDLRTKGRVRESKNDAPGLSPKTVRGIHMMLHTALEQAVKEDIIRKNPTNGCIPPKIEKKEMKVIQPEQIGDYLQAAANRNVLPMFYLELTSGLRRGELLALLWSDLDVEQHTVSVNKSVAGRHGELKVSAPKTRHSIRKVTIPQQAVDLLIQEHALHPDNPYMFPSPVTGTMYHPDAVGRIHKKLLKEAGIENVRFHDLRHTFATIALQNGVDVKTLSHILGHFSSGFTLDTYTHVTAKMQQEAAEKMGSFMKMTL